MALLKFPSKKIKLGSVHIHFSWSMMLYTLGIYASPQIAPENCTQRRNCETALPYTLNRTNCTTPCMLPLLDSPLHLPLTIASWPYPLARDLLSFFVALLQPNSSSTTITFGTDTDCFAELLEFAAFIKLRTSHRELHRPYAIPFGTSGVCILLLPGAFFVILLVIFSSRLTWAVSGVAVLVGLGLYPGLQYAKRRQWCDFCVTALNDGD